MVVDSDKILFFFGAWGSAEFGIPPMRKMAEDFKSIINQQNLPEERDAYNEIVKMLRDDMGPDVDIEAIFLVIDGLQEYNIENIGELSIYISKKFFKDTLLHKKIASKTILQSLEKDFQRFIRKSCALKRPFGEKMS
jgi:cobalamin biosynthesis Co2+ chelatase CbiK